MASQLRARRQAAGLSMTALAALVGMDLAKLSRLEHGQRELKVRDVLRLARALGCQPVDLLPTLEDVEPVAVLKPAAEGGTHG